ncbi:unnamed protein product, partial [Ectocarpus sp. 6 AP-2014]
HPAPSHPLTISLISPHSSSKNPKPTIHRKPDQLKRQDTLSDAIRLTWRHNGRVRSFGVVCVRYSDRGLIIFSPLRASKIRPSLGYLSIYLARLADKNTDEN